MKDKMTIEYTDSDFRQAIEERFFAGDEMAARHARGEFTKQNFTECYEKFRNESEFQFGEQRYERRYQYAI